MIKVSLKPLLFLLLFTVNEARGVEPLNQGFNEILSSLKSSGDSSGLLLREFEMVLNLQYASEKLIIFSDAKVKTDERSAYQIAKWSFSPEVISEAIGKSNQKFKVTFIVRRVEKERWPSMPHIYAEIMQLNEIQQD